MVLTPNAAIAASRVGSYPCAARRENMATAADSRPMKREVRRRRTADQQSLANTVVLPSSVAERLKMEGMAVLAVIRDDAKATGRCTLPLARIAERANIGRAKARAAIRLAESLGIIASSTCRMGSALS
jgi:hypothetical protein